MTANSHTAIRDALLERIQSGEWPLGERIPREMVLAEEYGCARTTINRSLQALADSGLLIRKRKGGTRVCAMPVRQAKFEIPIIREQVEASGNSYRHKLLISKLKVPPSSIRTRLRVPTGQKALYLETIHLADVLPYAFEIRWVNVQAVPTILNASLIDLSLIHI